MTQVFIAWKNITAQFNEPGNLSRLYILYRAAINTEPTSDWKDVLWVHFPSSKQLWMKKYHLALQDQTQSLFATHFISDLVSQFKAVWTVYLGLGAALTSSLLSKKAPVVM